jgi:hypothetical protein
MLIRRARTVFFAVLISTSLLGAVAGTASADRITATTTAGVTCNFDSYLGNKTTTLSPAFFQIFSQVHADCPWDNIPVPFSGGTYLFETRLSTGRRVVASKTGSNTVFTIRATYDYGSKSFIYDSTGDVTVNIPASKNFTWRYSSRPTNCTIYNAGKSIWCWGLNDSL